MRPPALRSGRPPPARCAFFLCFPFVCENDSAVKPTASPLPASVAHSFLHEHALFLKSIAHNHTPPNSKQIDFLVSGVGTGGTVRVPPHSLDTPSTTHTPQSLAHKKKSNTDRFPGQRRRYGRHHHRLRALPQGAEPQCQGVCGRPLCVCNCVCALFQGVKLRQRGVMHHHGRGALPQGAEPQRQGVFNRACAHARIKFVTERAAPEGSVTLSAAWLRSCRQRYATSCVS